MAEQIEIEVVEGNALEFEADVLALKHAQALFGLDEAVVTSLRRAGRELELPAPGSYSLLHGGRVTETAEILFIGVVPLHEFDYEEIRRFGHRALSSLAEERPRTRHVALTLHGAGYGLDEVEAFESEVAGLAEAIAGGEVPRDLRRISFVERNKARSRRLRKALLELLPEGTLPRRAKPVETSEEEGRAQRLRAAGYSSSDKDHIFVAMPFKEDMDDTYHYGIQGAARAAGFVCERADLSSFTGDVLEWVKKRIRSASLLIADLTDANPNVYLEVGYAWGCGVPTVLVVRHSSDGDLGKHLKFDTRGQRCLSYKTIKDLEESLSKELSGLDRASGS